MRCSNSLKTAFLRTAVIALAVIIPATACSSTATQESTAVVDFVEPRIPAAPSGTYTVSEPNGTTVRDLPGHDNEPVGRIAAGTVVSITGRAFTIEGDTWFEIQEGDVLGWVVQSDLTENDREAAEVLSKVEVAEPQSSLLLPQMVSAYPGANLRNAPEGDISAELAYGTSVTPTGNRDNGWVEVTSGELSGWIWGDLVGPLAPAETAEATPAAASQEVTPGPNHEGVNLRSAPGGDIVGGIPAGDTATTTGNESNGWIEVTHDGVTGWAFADVLVAT